MPTYAPTEDEQRILDYIARCSQEMIGHADRQICIANELDEAGAERITRIQWAASAHSIVAALNDLSASICKGEHRKEPTP